MFSVVFIPSTIRTYMKEIVYGFCLWFLVFGCWFLVPATCIVSRDEQETINEKP